jgi:Zn-dependent peptidase ImmA (M78 family)/transcriptional regulator with XRE-family HTH domain
MNIAFNGAELRLARIFNGLALEEVAERVEKTRQYVHKLETGQAAPTELLLEQLALVLQVEPGFFTSAHTLMIGEDQFHFRKLFTTRAMIKQVAMARGELTSRLVNYLDRELKLPELRIPETPDAQTPEDIERAAELCRREWGLGLGPIANMNRLAEHVGAIVTSFQSVSKEIDALSVAVKRPIIVRNEAKESVCRQRFDIGHELGHFVLHAGQTTGDRITESQANRFASALLIPRTMMAKLFPKPRGSRLDWAGMREFKLTWKVSKAAILYRARQLELISDDQYKTGVITLRRTGEAAGEREDNLIPQEVPELLARSLAVLAEKKGIYAEEVASELHVLPVLLREVVGFDLTVRVPSTVPPDRQYPGLYLVT